MKLGQTLSIIVLGAALTTGCGKCNDPQNQTEPQPPTYEQYNTLLGIAPVNWIGPASWPFGDGFLDDMDRDGHVDAIHKMYFISWAAPGLESRVDLKKLGFVIKRNDGTNTITPEMQEALDKAYKAAIDAGYALTKAAYAQRK